MAGAGTLTDPYIVSTWEEMESLLTSGGYIKFTDDCYLGTVKLKSYNIVNREFTGFIDSPHVINYSGTHVEGNSNHFPTQINFNNCIIDTIEIEGFDYSKADFTSSSSLREEGYIVNMRAVVYPFTIYAIRNLTVNHIKLNTPYDLFGGILHLINIKCNDISAPSVPYRYKDVNWLYHYGIFTYPYAPKFTNCRLVINTENLGLKLPLQYTERILYYYNNTWQISENIYTAQYTNCEIIYNCKYTWDIGGTPNSSNNIGVQGEIDAQFYLFFPNMLNSAFMNCYIGGDLYISDKSKFCLGYKRSQSYINASMYPYYWGFASSKNPVYGNECIVNFHINNGERVFNIKPTVSGMGPTSGTDIPIFYEITYLKFYNSIFVRNNGQIPFNDSPSESTPVDIEDLEDPNSPDNPFNSDTPPFDIETDDGERIDPSKDMPSDEQSVPHAYSPFINNGEPFLKTINHSIIIPNDVNRFGTLDIQSNISYGAFLYNKSLPDRIMYNNDEIQFVVLSNGNSNTAYFQSVYKNPPCVVSIPFNIIDNNDSGETDKNNYRYRKNRESTYSKFINNQWTDEPILKQVDTDGESAVLNQEVHLSGNYYGNWESQRCVNYSTENYVDNELVVKNNNTAYIVSKNFMEDLSWTICIKAKANEYSDTSVLFNLLLLRNDLTTNSLYIHAKGEKYYSNINKEFTEREITCDFSKSHEFMIMCSNYNDYKYVILFIDKEYIDIFDIGGYNGIVQCSIGLVKHDTFDSTNLKNFFGSIDYIDIYSSDLNRDYNKEYFEFVEITATEVDENRELTRASRKFESANELLEYMKESENTIYNLSIQTPDDVCFIDNYTFDKCNQINEVVFDDGPSELAKDCYDTGVGLFSNCTNLSKMTLPDTLININNAMFTKCSNLSYINIPNNLKNIGAYAFNDCTSLTTINGISESNIETIGERAFLKSSISSLILPSTITFIGESAFNSCKSLTEVTLCGYISDYAFNVCTALETVNVCESKEITHIGENAFNNTAIYNSVNDISYIGKWLYKVKNIDDEGILELRDDTVGVAVKGANTNKIKSVIFNDTLKYIDDFAFSNSQITSAILPNTVIEIGKSAFANCTQLQTLSLPVTITTIPFGLCSKCGELLNINLENIEIINDKAFADCTNLNAIILGNKLKYIGKYAFSNCTTIKQLNLYDDIYIDYWFIKNCTSLESLYLPNTINNTDYCDLDTLTGLKEISVSDSNKYYLAENNILYRKSCSYFIYSGFSYDISDKGVVVYVPCNYQETDIDIPADTIIIYKSAFADCKNIEHITFNSPIMYINDSAFANCDNLIDVSIELAPLENKTSVTIPNKCFFNCSNLENINISQTSWDLVTHINDNAFDGCESLILNNLPNSLVSVWNEAFNNCKNIQISSLPETLQEIGGGAFYGCENICISDTTNLTNINRVGGSAFAFSGIASPILNQNITSIASYTYQGCNNITSLTIPSNITSIGDYAFSECDGITNVNINSNITNISLSAFMYCKSIESFSVIDTNTKYSAVDGVLFEQDSMSGKYLMQYPAGNSRTTYTLPNDIVKTSGSDYTLKIRPNAFSNASNLKTIIIPENVTFIDRDASFSNWTGVETLIIPSNVKKINSTPFNNCTNLKTIYIHKNMTLLANTVFTGCDNVTDIYLDFVSTSTSSVKTNAPYGATNAKIHYMDENITRVEFTGAPKTEYNQRETISIENLKVIMYYEDSEHNEYSIDVTKKAVVSPAVGTVMADAGEFTLTVTYTGLNEVDYSKSYNISVGEKNAVRITQLDENNEKTDTVQEVETIANAVTFLKNHTSNRYDIDIPNNVGTTEFTNSQFKNCTALYSISIPTDFSTINNELFSGCTNLNTVTLPNTITTIGTSAFNNCTNLTNITIPQSVQVIETNAFKGCTNIINGTSECYKDNWLLSYSGATGEISIADNTIGIASSTFSGNRNITSVTLPDSVLYINHDAFYGCSKLTNINIPESIKTISNNCFYGCIFTNITLPHDLKHIGNNAFRNCTKLNNIVIPNSVTYIGTNAFYGCTAFTEITLPDSIESVESDSFYNCTNVTTINIGNNLINIDNLYLSSKLQEINVSDNNEYLSSVDGVLYNKAKTTLIKVPKATNITDLTIANTVTTISADAIRECSNITNISIPDSVLSIGSHAFYDSKATFTIPNNISSIESYAFSDCINITEYVSSNTITSIGDYAFNNCTKLESVTINENIISIGKYCFNGCSKLMNLTINNGIKYIDIYAFANCSLLNNVTMPDSVETLGERAFSKCTSLTNITISENIQTNGNYVFSECSNLETIVLPDNLPNISGMFNKCTKLKNVNIPNNITSIGNYAFSECSSIESINIPDGITSIGDYAFYKCSKLFSINIAKSGLFNIGSYAFGECSLLPNQHIENTSLQTISNGAFSGCSSITSMTIPDTVTSIREKAFANCTNLTTSNIPTKISSIATSLFENCTNLTNITIPDNITSIGNSAFKGCESFTNIVIPDTVTSIDRYAFINCINLESCNIPNNLKVISESTFQNCKKLVNVSIPESVTTIGISCFNGCESIESINIPKSVTTIYSTPFLGCKSLKSISVDSDNTKFSSVDDVLFDKTVTNLIAYPIDKDITEYSVPNTVTTITNYSFAYSLKLTTINIPSSVTSISSNTFQYSENIATINIDKTTNSIRYYPWGATSATINWIG